MTRSPRRRHTPTDAGLWALRPLVQPAPPTVRATSWVSDPIDAFILAPSGARRAGPRGSGRSSDTDPPGDVRPDRTSADSCRDRCLPRRPLADGLRTLDRSAARLAALRRALGAALAGRGPVLREPWIRIRSYPRPCLALSRLRDRQPQRRPAVFPIRRGAGRRRRAGADEPRGDQRHGVPGRRALGPGEPDPEERHDAAAGARGGARGHGRGRRPDLPRAHRQLCPMPRSQVRPGPPAGLLPDQGGPGGRPAWQPCSAVREEGRLGLCGLSAGATTNLRPAPGRRGEEGRAGRGRRTLCRPQPQPGLRPGCRRRPSPSVAASWPDGSRTRPIR